MSSYAILGATGKTGQSLLQVLSKPPQNRLNLYVRSKSKLLRQQPGVESSPNVKIFEGELNDTQLIGSCLSGTAAAFLVVAVNANVPGCSVAQDTAQAVVAALEELRAQDVHVKLPRLVILSSASINPRLSRGIPAVAHWVLMTASSYLYADLVKAEEYLRSKESWLTATFVQPGGLVHDEQRGHELSFDRQQTFVSYLDLAAGMIEVADAEGDQYDWKGVSVLPTAKNVKVEWMVPFYMVHGIAVHYFPWAYGWIL